MSDGETIDFEGEEKIWRWSQTRERCACCWIPHRKAEFYRLGLQTHHIVKRSRSRCDEPWNLLRLCSRCHDLAELHTIREYGVELPKLHMPICLTLKREADADEWRPDSLQAIYAMSLPELEPVPDVYLRERERWEPIVPWRKLAS